MLLAPVSSRRVSWALMAVVVLAIFLSIRQRNLLFAADPKPQYSTHPKPLGQRAWESDLGGIRETDAGSQERKPGSPPARNDASLDNIHNSTLGFEKIFVVSLPARTDRRDGMVLQAALSRIDVEFIDGVQGAAVAEKAIPKAESNDHIQGPELGSWRGHINAIHEIIRRNLSSALILEDDGDWDIRFKDQLSELALATRALTQPLAGRPGRYADPTYPKRPPGSPSKHLDIPFARLPETIPPETSPYGDDWDVLWLGHCGQAFVMEDNMVLPRGRVIYTDKTIPPKHYLDSPFIQPYSLKDEFPDFTRVVHHSQFGVCSLAYAVSQRGARRLMLELGLKPLDAPYDLMLRAYCQGDRGQGRSQCLTTQPSMVNHHRQPGPIKTESDIKMDELSEDFRETGETAWIQRPVRLNTAALLYGATELPDQYPAEVKPPVEKEDKEQAAAREKSEERPEENKERLPADNKEAFDEKKEQPPMEKKEESDAGNREGPAEDQRDGPGEKARKVFRPQRPVTRIWQ